MPKINYTIASPSVCSLLGVAFVVLKLLNVIDWSWWWVTAPFWGPLVLTIFIIVPIILVGFALSKRWNKFL